MENGVFTDGRKSGPVVQKRAIFESPRANGRLTTDVSLRAEMVEFLNAWEK